MALWTLVSLKLELDLGLGLDPDLDMHFPHDAVAVDGLCSLSYISVAILFSSLQRASTTMAFYVFSEIVYFDSTLPGISC